MIHVLHKFSRKDHLAVEIVTLNQSVHPVYVNHVVNGPGELPRGVLSVNLTEFLLYLI